MIFPVCLILFRLIQKGADAWGIRILMPAAQMQPDTPRRPLSDDFCVVITLDPTTYLSRVADTDDARTRERRLHALHRHLKRPLLASLARYHDVGLYVLENPDAIPQMILAGPRPAWQLFLAENIAFFPDLERIDLGLDAAWQVY